MRVGTDDDRREVAGILATLFTVFPAAQVSDDVARSRAKTYMAALEGRPVWAIERAAMRWIKGEVKAEGRALDFPPSPARLVELTIDSMRPLYAEITALQKITRAVVIAPITEAERAARLTRFQTILAGTAA